MTTDERTVLAEDLRFSKKVLVRDEEDHYIRISLANARGMTIAEIAEELGETTSTVQRWKVKGDEARDKRRSGDPEQRGELATDG